MGQDLPKQPHFTVPGDEPGTEEQSQAKASDQVLPQSTRTTGTAGHSLGDGVALSLALVSSWQTLRKLPKALLPHPAAFLTVRLQSTARTSWKQPQVRTAEPPNAGTISHLLKNSAQLLEPHWLFS